MLALLAAAVLAAPPQVAPKSFVLAAPPGRSCGYWQANPVRQGKIKPRLQNLGELPPANHELTVLRTDENGCSVAVTVRENVNGDGRFAPNR